MKNKIVKWIEEEYNVTILSMREVGSRAYDLHTENSDHDAYFVFMQDPIQYMNVSGYTQNIGREFGEWELQGWNIKRFGELLSKSNPTIIEFLQSDEKVHSPYEKDFDKLADYAENNVKPIAVYYHYLNLANDQYMRYFYNKEVGHKNRTVKRLLFIMRGITYAQYIREKKRMPPVAYTDFPEYHKESYEIFGRLALMKINGHGSKNISETNIDMDRVDRIIKNEMDLKLDNDEYTIRGISNEYINNFIETVIQ